MKEEKVSRAMEHLDDGLILSAMDESDTVGRKKSKIFGGKTMNGALWKRWLPLAAAFVFIFSAVIIVANLLSGAPATLALDVNPSIEIEVDEDGLVDEVRALNEDARVVLAGLVLEDTTVTEAASKIVASMVEKNYISEAKNSILLSVDSDSRRQAKKLRERIAGEIDGLLKGKNIEASVIAQLFDKDGAETGKAGEMNISRAKAALIYKIVNAGLLDAGGVPYSYETLASLRVHELKLILQSKGINVGGITSSGKANAGGYISAEAAIEAALAKAALAKADVSALKTEMDYDDDRRMMVYEVEFRYNGQEYDYEISAADGAVLEEEIEPINEREDVKLPEGVISREEALNKALADAGVSSGDARRVKIETDKERGAVVYEVEFKDGKYEYEYTVNAVTGEIIEREKEPID